MTIRNIFSQIKPSNSLYVQFLNKPNQRSNSLLSFEFGSTENTKNIGILAIPAGQNKFVSCFKVSYQLNLLPMKMVSLH